MNVHNLPVTPARLRHIAGRLGLSERAYSRAREIAGFAPDAEEWRRLMDRFLLVFGTALIVAGITAFFAYNWGGLHKFQKFGFIEVGIVASVGLAWWRGLDSAAGRAALFAAAFLVGVLLAVYSQVYQTGADPYELFVVWGLLILGWVVIGSQASLWMLLLVLVNLGVILFWTQVLYPQGAGMGLLGPLVALSGTFIDPRLANLVFALNTAALVLWEVLARGGGDWMQGRVFPRVFSLFALAPIVVSTLILILDSKFFDENVWYILSFLLFIGFTALSYFYYRFRVHDLFILTACLVGGIMMVTATVGRFGGEGIGMSLVLPALVIGQTTGAAFWLRRVAQEWEEGG